MAVMLMVRSMTVEADGVLGLELVDPAGGVLPPWQPGAHLSIVLGAGTTALVRQYSLCGDPSDGSRYRLGVLRERSGRGGSALVHDTLRPGDLLEVRGPTNNFPLTDAAEYLFIAGGIGVTPLLPMVETVAARSLPYRFLYGGRSTPTMAYVDRLLHLGDGVTLWPQDTHGLLDLRGAIGSPREGMAVYACGPEPLLQAVESIMADWPSTALHVERFTAPATVPGVGVADAATFEVVLARSGRRLLVAARQSVLDVLLDAGVDVVNDCREGICASCETGVVRGEIDHRDFVLSAAEKQAGDVMMACVSRAAGPELVLDL